MVTIFWPISCCDIIRKQYGGCGYIMVVCCLPYNYNVNLALRPRCVSSVQPDINSTVLPVNNPISLPVSVNLSSVSCSSCGHISKTEQDRPIVSMEHYTEIGITDSIAIFRSFHGSCQQSASVVACCNCGTTWCNNHCVTTVHMFRRLYGSRWQHPAMRHGTFA